MKYKVTLNGKTYEVEVEAGQAMKFFEARKAKEENICKYSIVEA